MKSISGRVVLVVGAGRGMGRSVVELFCSLGARVAAADVTPVNLDETARLVREAGGDIRTYVTDITRKMPVQGLLNQVLDDLGEMDILVNCAEVEPCKSLLEMDEWDWARTLDVNLTGAFLLTQSAARIMKQKGAGIILHAGERAKGQEERIAYLAGKRALQVLVQESARELAPCGIRVALIHSAQEALEVCTA